MIVDYRISQIGEVVGGGTPSTSIEEYWDGDIPWISPKDLTGYNAVYIEHGESFITKNGLNKSGTRLLPANTVLLSSRAPIGYLAIAKNPLCTNQGFKSIICNERIVDPLYLYYYLKANLSYIKLFGSGATFPEISAKTMNKIRVSIISNVEKQISIAKTLLCYDSLIEVNNKRIKTLEQMAENLYKEWFVRFRFPGHENTEFENGIPKGWNYFKFSTVYKTIRGVSYTSEEIDCDTGENLINLKNIKAFGGFRKDGTKKYCGRFKQEQVVRKNDLVMGVTDMTQDRRTVGSVALVPDIEGVISADLILLKSSLSNIFSYYLIKAGGYSRLFSEFGNGANVIHLKPGQINNQKILIPSVDTINQFVKIVDKIINQINALEQKNDNLSKQRDLLLPRLMSGKLEV